MRFLSFILAFLIIGSTSAQKPRLKVQNGHLTFVSSSIFFNQGRHLISGSIGGNVKIWEVSTGREVDGFATKVMILDMHMSADESTLAIADIFQNVTFWDISTGTQKDIEPIKFAPASPTHGLNAGVPGAHSQTYRPLASNGELVAIANQGDLTKNFLKSEKVMGVVSIHEIISGKAIKSFHTKKAVAAISLNQNGLLAVVGADNSLSLWDAAKGKKKTETATGQSGVYSVAISSTQIVTGGSNGSLKVWDLELGQVADLSNPGGDITSVDITKNNQTVVSTDKKGTTLWDWNTNQPSLQLDISNTTDNIANIYNLARFDSQSQMVASTWFGAIIIYDIKSGRKLQILSGTDMGLNGCHFLPGTYSPAMIYMGADKMVAKKWLLPDVTSSVIPVNSAGKKVLIDRGLNYMINYVPIQDQDITLFKVADQTNVTLKGHTKPIYSAVFSADGTRVITGSADNTIRIWSTESGQELKQLTRRAYGNYGFTGNIFISDDGKKIVSRGTRNVNMTTTPTQIWDIETGRARNLSGVVFVRELCSLSRDGQLLSGVIAIFEKKESVPAFVIYDTSTGQKVFEQVGLIGTLVNRFSPDSKSIAISLVDGIGVYDIEKGEQKFLLDHTNVDHISYSDDGKRLLTGGVDGFTKVWDPNTGKEIAAYVSYRDNENTIVLPNRYYYSSKGALDGLHYVMDGKAIPFDQFDLQYNRPDLVFTALGVDNQPLIESYNKAYKKRLAKSGISENMFTEEYHLPQAIIKTELPVTTNQKSVKIKIEASDTKYNLSKIIISVNNIPIDGQIGIKINSGQSFEQEFEIQLTSGRNKIGVQVINEIGTKSIESTIETQYTGPETQSDLYLITIGVSEYQDASMNLTYAAKDAKDIAALFDTQADKYNSINITQIINESVTKEKITEIGQELKNTKVDDEVIIFLAGHGLLDSKLDYYFGTHDIDFNDPAARGLKYETINGFLDGIPARKKLLMIDACHSGEVDKDDDSSGPTATIKTTGSVKFRGFDSSQRKTVGLQSSFQLMKELYSDLRRGTGAMVISSAGGAEFAFESADWNNGVFTYALLEGLKSGNCDLNSDGNFSVSEIREYVIESVMNLTNGQQTPTSRSENLEFDFNIW